MLNTIRRACYRLARILGDVQAVSKGPTAIVKRIALKTILKRVGRIIR